MSNKPLLLTDVDGVLLDFIQGFSIYLETLGHDISHTKSYWGSTKRATFDGLMRIADPQQAAAVKAGFYQSEAIAHLPLMQTHLINIMQTLSEHMDIVCITCIGRTQQLMDARRKNLHDHFGDCFKAIHCLDFGESKLPLLRHYQKQQPLAYIDDRQEHIDEAIQANINGRLFEHNVPKTQVNSVTCWHEFSQQLLAMPSAYPTLIA